LSKNEGSFLLRRAPLEKIQEKNYPKFSGSIIPLFSSAKKFRGRFEGGMERSLLKKIN
jgi:hypothetical protein